MLLQKVKKEWVDFNNHMQDAYYNLVFSDDMTVLLDKIGMDHAYRLRTKNTLYTVETHNFYLDEITCHEEFSIEHYIVGHAPKKLHLWQVMIKEKTQSRIAIQETMLLCVSQKEEQPKSTIFEDDIYQKIIKMHDVFLQSDSCYFTHRARKIGT